MRKALKLALEPEQISVKNSYPMIDGFEIHLYGDQRDHFELYEMLEKPVFTIHYPLNKCDVVQISHDFKNGYVKN